MGCTSPHWQPPKYGTLPLPQGPTGHLSQFLTSSWGEPSDILAFTEQNLIGFLLQDLWVYFIKRWKSLPLSYPIWTRLLMYVFIGYLCKTFWQWVCCFFILISTTSLFSSYLLMASSCFLFLSFFSCRNVLFLSFLAWSKFWATRPL